MNRNKKIDEAILFVDKEIRPYASSFDENGEFPLELVKKMGHLGFLGAPYPKSYGGLAFDPIDYGTLTEIFGKACCTIRSMLTVHTSLVGETILRWGNDEQKNTYIPSMVKGSRIGAFALSEPLVGSNAKGITTNYIKKEDKYIINGKKKWITLGGIADFFIVIASNNGISTAFIVNKKLKGVSTKRIHGMMAAKASYISEIDFKDVEVSEKDILGKIGGGFSFIVNTALDYGRYSIAWGGLAVSQEALECMVRYSRERTQFGQKLYNHQLIKEMIAEAVTKIHAARALCIKAGEMRKNSQQEAEMETTIAKHFTATIAQKITSDAVQIHGANGCCNAFPAERLFREAKILEIIEGTSQIQQEIISRFGLRKYFINY
jgi:alkylation response protein AidB-like acyl-CoA dehydrogenase